MVVIERHQQPAQRTSALGARLPVQVEGVGEAGVAPGVRRSARRSMARRSWRALWKSPRHNSAVPSRTRR
ncbi:hypothetical protein [Streptosporangium sp. NBC_01469]|uniref:hypothetical protein n=1 Tax=Streptosporangium sp. NBC_01469 TaxID=2903898 RepID=UPI002E2CBC39|nr:hypothetical protein [Streptosporangium sp. NBC_01469]